MRFLFLAFIAVPMLEMWILIEVGRVIGGLPTIGLVALTAIIGASMLKRQGLATLTRAQQRMESGQVPATELIEGLLLAVGGALLLTPGFVTDVIGFCCLIPATRQALAQAVIRRGIVQQASAQGFYQAGPGAGPSSGRSGYDSESDIIEGEVVGRHENVDDRDKMN